MKSDVLSGTSLENSKELFFKDLQSFSSSINKNRYSLLGSSSILSVGWADCLRTFMEQFRDNEAAIKNLVITSLAYLNSTCPHAVELYIRSLIDGNVNVSEKHQHKRVSSSQVFSSLLYEGSDPYIQQHSNQLIECLKLAGSSGHISVKVREDIHHGSLNLEEGFRANCNIDDFFFEHVGGLEMPNCKVIVIDGKILDVGEIHHVLQNSYETKQRFAIVSTGLSDDVSNTLFVNWQQGKTNVVPFYVNDDVKNINEVKDISVSCGVTPCSSETGKLISSIDIDSIPTCTLTYDRLKGLKIMPGSAATHGVAKLRNELQGKISKCRVDDVRDLLVKRLSKLSLRNVLLNIPGELKAKGILEDKLNSFFSHVARCASQGVIDVRQLYYEDYHIDLLPSQDAKIAISRAVSDRSAIDNIRAVIRLERD